MKRLRNQKGNLIFRVVIIILIFLSLGIFVWVLLSSRETNLEQVPSPATLGETRTAVILSPTPTPTPSPSPSPSPRPSINPKPTPNKSSYIIAAFGDSMVDTMGENLDYLDKEMTAIYPTTKFKFYNFGVGSQNVVEAGKRFDSPLVYKDRNYPAISQINPDIIIISSFAYNPLSPYNKSVYLSGLKEVINKAKSTNAQIYLLAEIAPIRVGFGKGVGGVNWSDAQVQTHVGYIFQNLDGAVNLASQEKIPLINAYEKSQVDGKYGNKIYVGSHDGIHPSIEGEVFMAEIIAETLKLP